MTKNQQSPVTAVAKEKRRSVDGVVTLSTGVRAKLKPVSASLIAEVTTRIHNPDPPVWHDPDKDRDEPNPADPSYVRAMGEADNARARATMDTLVLFGVDLVDGLPEDDSWLKNLRYLEKLGHLSLEDYNPDDPIDREFLFKRFVAVSVGDMAEIMRRTGITEEQITAAAETFKSTETRGAAGELGT